MALSTAWRLTPSDFEIETALKRMKLIGWGATAHATYATPHATPEFDP
jgi:hypothetical protein